MRKERGKEGECKGVKETTVVLYPMRKIRKKGMEKHWTKEKRFDCGRRRTDGSVFSTRRMRDTIIT